MMTTCPYCGSAEIKRLYTDSPMEFYGCATCFAEWDYNIELRELILVKEGAYDDSIGSDFQ